MADLPARLTEAGTGAAVGFGVFGQSAPFPRS
jgi:hypothetical protein